MHHLSPLAKILHHLSPPVKFSQPPFSLEKIPHHLFHLWKFRITFFTCENFVSPFSLAKFSHLLFLLQNFRSFISHLRNPHVIFRYFAPTLLDFYLKIFCVIIYSLDSFQIGVSVDSCPHNGPWQWCHLIRVQLVFLDCGPQKGVINKIYNLYHHALG